MGPLNHFQKMPFGHFRNQQLKLRRMMSLPSKIKTFLKNRTIIKVNDFNEIFFELIERILGQHRMVCAAVPAVRGSGPDPGQTVPEDRSLPGIVSRNVSPLLWKLSPSGSTLLHSFISLLSLVSLVFIILSLSSLDPPWRN